MSNCPFCDSVPVVAPYRHRTTDAERFVCECVNETCPQSPSAYGDHPVTARQAWEAEVEDNFGIAPDGTLKPERLEKLRASYRKVTP